MKILSSPMCLFLVMLFFCWVEANNESAQNDAKMKTSNFGDSINATGEGKRKLKILVYSPTLGWSHSQFMGTVADTLAGAGHEVVCNIFVVWRKTSMPFVLQ